MNMLIRVVISRLLLTVILAAPISAAAQTAPLQVGEKIRIRWTFGSPYPYGLSTMRSVVAHVVDYDAGHVMLRRGHRMFTVPTGSITTLERRIGTKPASAPAMVIGSGVGFAVGFVAGLLKSQIDRTSDGHDVIDSGLAAGILGAPIGALVAYINSRSRGIYEDVGLGNLAPGLVMRPSGRVGLSLTIGGR